MANSSTTVSTAQNTVAATGWPFSQETLHGRYLSVTPLAANHIPKLWPLLADIENARLFRVTYAGDYKDYDAFRDTLYDHDALSPGSITYTVAETSTSTPIGWLLLHSFTTSPKALECAVFLTPQHRGTCVFDGMGIVTHHCIATLGYDRVDFRRGSQFRHSMQNYSNMGFSLLAMLRKQIHVPERSQETDFYSIRKEVWPPIFEASQAWLDSHPIVFDSG